MTARRTRSPLYPAIALEAALHRAKSLHLAAEDRAVPIPIAAGAWHYRADSSLAAQTVAALRQYGLAEDAGRGPQRTVQVTAAAMQILTNKSDTQRRKFLQEAALRPKIHGELWKLLNQGPISKPDVRDYLVNQRTAGKFNHKRVDQFY